ncbi:AMP-binding protein [Nakamurella leprariae]
MRRLAEQEPDAVSISCDGELVTRGELERRSNRLARAFAQRGARHGDFIVIALPNGIDWFVAYFATLKIGAIPLPLSARLPLIERQAIVALGRPALLVGVDPSDHPEFTCLPVGFEPEAALADGPLDEVVSPSWKAPTSGGSTGRPKIIVAGSPAEGSPELNSVLWQMRADDVQMVVGPLYHNGPLIFAIGGLLLGQHVVVMRRFDAGTLLALMELHKVTWVLLVPTMMHRMHRLLEDGRRVDLSSVRLLWHGSAKCADWLKQAWIDRLGPERVWEFYGGTEALAATMISGTEWLEHRGSVGRVVVGSMRVLDPSGREVPTGTVGEIYMKRPAGMAETYRYVGSDAHRSGEWETIGDLGWKDADGYVYIHDRRVDLIVTGGSNVYPAEVEEALEAHPGVLSSVVVGLPDDDLGHRVHALVQAEPGTSEQDVMEFLEHRIVRYKIPRSIEFIDAPLRDDAGKVRRSQMRDEAIARQRTAMTGGSS